MMVFALSEVSTDENGMQRLAAVDGYQLQAIVPVPNQFSSMP